jgi:hypothetical protein
MGIWWCWAMVFQLKLANHEDSNHSSLLGTSYLDWRLFNRINHTCLNQLVMKLKTYRIVFQDKDSNDHFEKSMQFFDLKDAKRVAKVLLANLCDNEVTKFKIYAK